MRINVKVGRGVVVTKRKSTQTLIAEVDRHIDNCKAAVLSANRYRQSLIAKGYIKPIAA